MALALPARSRALFVRGFLKCEVLADDVVDVEDDVADGGGGAGGGGALVDEVDEECG